MEKLKNIKNYHFGMGILILLIQIIFQISNSVYLFGFMLILFSFYESMIIKKLKHQKREIEKVRKILNQFKWFNFFALVPILLIIGKLITDTTNINISEIAFSNPILWINALVIGGIVMHLSIKLELRKIEKEITGI